MKTLNDIKGILCDLDGVMYVSNKPIEGSIEAIKALREKGKEIRFLTNTSGRTVSFIQQRLHDMGLEVSTDHIINPPKAALEYMRQQDIKRFYPALPDSVSESFKQEFTYDEGNPEIVLMGDLGIEWNADLMNKLFGMVMNGAKILTLNKGKFWKTSKGIQMGIGAYVAGLEYTTGTEAVVLGKPSASFFELGVKSLGMPKDQIIMVGDDIEGDVGGAQEAGIRGVLVRTGKYQKAFADASVVQPDLVVDDLAALVNF
ncbi:TIGR01458 family HAD-type hydrolase [Algivirga pacifica]|uniref:Haloacid dehalogenase-like hydrolase domain-containing protein 2 n=1 Tax=Algivirga pacifica TaxID=1162670 RepID=A0ABP9D5G0_9BACT